MLNKYLSLPIRIHFLILVFLLAVPFLCIILYVGFGERKDALKDAQNESFKFVSSIAREEQVLVTGIRQLATTIALLPEIATPDSHKITPLLKEILKENPQYTNITISDESGRMLESAMPFKKGASVAHLKYFKEAVRSGMFSSGEYFVGRMTNKPIMIFGYPVKNAAGQLIRVIGVGIDFIDIRHVFEKLNFPTGSSFSLLDHKGTILYRHLQDNPSTNLAGNQDIKTEIFTSMQEGPEEGTFTAEGNDGNWQVFVYKKLTLPHEVQPYLYIRSRIPQSSVINKASHRIFVALSVISLLSFAGLFWAWFIGKRIIVDRVTALENASKQLAVGTEIFKVSQVVKGGDLGELAKAIDRMAETLHQREKILRTVLEASQETVFMIDLDGHILVMNSTTAHRLGKKPEDMLEKCVYDFWPSGLAISRKIQIDKAVLTGQSFQFSDQHDGRWYEHTIYPVSGSNAVVIYSRDDTERRRVEEETRELLLMLEAVPNCILIHDTDGNFLYVNQKAFNLHGYSKDEFMALNLKQITVPATEALIDKRMQELLDRGEAAFEVEHYKKDGTTLPLWVNVKKATWNGKSVLLSVQTDITERKKSEKQLQDTLESLRKSMSTTIQVMVSAIEARDPYTAGHQLKSANLARAIATEMGLPPEKIEGIRMAGSIHDIGKISIPAEILSKPTKLSDIEFSLIKAHAQRGFEMLKDVESPWPLAEIVYQHHERMDGSGYPRNLKGEEICMEARILSVADVVEAMASHRPYRAGLGIDAALNEIEKNRGIFYDNTVADACLRLFREKGFKLEGT